MRFAVGLLVSVAFLPQGLASGTLQVGPAGLSFENGRSDDCIEALSGLCLASKTGGSSGDTIVDARQEMVDLEVRIDRDAINSAIGIQLLPGGDLVVAPSAYELPNPAFLLLAREIGTVRGQGQADGFGITFRENGMGGWFLAPRTEPLSMEIEQGGFWAPYASDDPEAERFYAFTNDSIRLGEDFGDTSSDARLNEVPRFVESISGGDQGAFQPLIDAYEAATPQLLIGGGLVGVEASTGNELTGAIHVRTSPEGPMGSRIQSEALPGPWLKPDNSRPFDTMTVPDGRGNGVPFERPAKPISHHFDPGVSEAPDGKVPIPLIPLTAAFALAVLAAVLYSRLKREDLIQAPHRARILAALEERGPLRLAALARLIGVDRTTVCYHAELLGRAGLVQTLRAGRSAYLGLPRQQLPPSSRAGGELGVAVRELLALHGGQLPRAQLHEMLPGVPQRTRNHALRQLLAAGAMLETPTETGTLLSLAR